MADLIEEAIECSTLIRVQPAVAYDGIATAEGLDGWFTDGASVDARPGGSIRFRWKNWGADEGTQEDGGPVLEADRPHRFVFQWQPDNPTYYTTVELGFKPHPEGVIVALKEYGYENTPSGRRALLECATGWGEALTLLKFYVEYKIVY